MAGLVNAARRHPDTSKVRNGPNARVRGCRATVASPAADRRGEPNAADRARRQMNDAHVVSGGLRPANVGAPVSMQRLNVAAGQKRHRGVQLDFGPLPPPQLEQKID